jgi:hypothetical protein
MRGVNATTADLFDLSRTRRMLRRAHAGALPGHCQHAAPTGRGHGRHQLG